MRSILVLFALAFGTNTYASAINYKTAMAVLMDSQDFYQSGTISKFLKNQIKEIQKENEGLNSEEAIALLVRHAEKIVN